MNKNIEKLQMFLQSSELKVLIVSHVSPDFDGLGSALTFSSQLLKLGIDNKLWIPDRLSENFKFLPNLDQCCKKFPENFNYNVLVVVDSSFLSRIRNYKQFKKDITIINIDHHGDNDYFGDINIVENVSSTGELMMDIFEQCGWDIDAEMATCLYGSLVYDTGQFRHANVTPKTLLYASKLVEKGIPHTLISQRIFEDKPLVFFDRVKEAIENLEVDFEHGFAYTVLGSYEENFSMIDFIRQIRDIDVYMVITKVDDHLVKVSLRSNSDFNVSRVAHTFGGGGHNKAAGIRIEGEFEDIKKRLIAALITERKVSNVDVIGS